MPTQAEIRKPELLGLLHSIEEQASEVIRQMQTIKGTVHNLKAAVRSLPITGASDG